MGRAPSDLTLRTIKAAHSVIWAFFAGCIVAIPVASWYGRHPLALGLIGVVFVEVLVLMFNRWRCPLTAVAAHYTDDRRENFDIYLPRWLARYNKHIFGSLYVASTVYAVIAWRLASAS